LLPASLLPLVLGSAITSSAPDPDVRGALYTRVLAGATERAQAELLAGIQLWKDHSRWEDPWIVESKHYSVRTTASHFVAAKIASDLEFMFGEFQRLLGSPFEPTQRFQIWIFPTIGDYNSFGANSDEHSSMYGAFYATQAPESPVATCYTPNTNLLGMFVTHGATHQFMENAFGGQPPTWIAEGLASYFSLYFGWAHGATELARLVHSGRFIPLEQLLDAPLPAYMDRPDERFIELGMLFNYLLNEREDTRIGAGGDPATGPFLEYVRAVLRGRNISQLDVAPLLAEDIEILEQDFKAHDFAK
jgi:hypothetical protein